MPRQSTGRYLLQQIRGTHSPWPPPDPEKLNLPAPSCTAVGTPWSLSSSKVCPLDHLGFNPTDLCPGSAGARSWSVEEDNAPGSLLYVQGHTRHGSFRMIQCFNTGWNPVGSSGVLVLCGHPNAGVAQRPKLSNVRWCLKFPDHASLNWQLRQKGGGICQTSQLKESCVLSNNQQFLKTSQCSKGGIMRCDGAQRTPLPRGLRCNGTWKNPLPSDPRPPSTGSTTGRPDASRYCGLP